MPASPFDQKAGLFIAQGVAVTVVKAHDITDHVAMVDSLKKQVETCKTRQGAIDVMLLWVLGRREGQDAGGPIQRSMLHQVNGIVHELAIFSWPVLGMAHGWVDVVGTCLFAASDIGLATVDTQFRLPPSGQKQHCADHGCGSVSSKVGIAKGLVTNLVESLTELSATADALCQELLAYEATDLSDLKRALRPAWRALAGLGLGPTGLELLGMAVPWKAQVPPPAFPVYQGKVGVEPPPPPAFPLYQGKRCVELLPFQVLQVAPIAHGAKEPGAPVPDKARVQDKPQDEKLQFELQYSADSQAQPCDMNLTAKRKQDFFDRSDAGEITTLMLCNLPCCIDHQRLADVVDSLGFRCKYDLLHVLTGGRSQKSKKSNLGYAFINFRNAQDAAAFTQAFSGYSFQGTQSSKRSSVRPAYVQGFDNTMELFRESFARRGFRGTVVCSL